MSAMATLDAVIRFDILPALTTDGGFTYDPQSTDLVTIGSRDGWAIAIPDTETIVGHDGVTTDTLVNAIAELIMAHADELSTGAVIGGWFSPVRNVYVVELSDIIVCDRDSAIAIAKLREQEAITNLRTGETIMI